MIDLWEIWCAHLRIMTYLVKMGLHCSYDVSRCFCCFRYDMSLRSSDMGRQTHYPELLVNVGLCKSFQRATTSECDTWWCWSWGDMQKHVPTIPRGQTVYQKQQREFIPHCPRTKDSGIVYSRKFIVHANDNMGHSVFIVHISMGSEYIGNVLKLEF